MPLIYHKRWDESTQIAVWENTEGDSFFEEKLTLFEGEIEELSALKPHRRSEWLCSRYLLKYLVASDDPFELHKDVFDKPHIKQFPKLNLSISHSRNRAAVIISNHSVGIDIQSQEDKIVRIHQKFISKLELSQLDQDHLIDAYHIHWGAKESMYKAWGKRELDFRQHMHLFPFLCFRNDLELMGYVEKASDFLSFKIFTDRLEDYYLVYTIQE